MTRRAARLIALLALLMAFMSAVAAGASAETVWTIRPVSASGILWLDSSLGTAAGGAPRVTTARPGVQGQLWRLVALPGHSVTDPKFRIVNTATDRCLIAAPFGPNFEYAVLQACGRFPATEVWRLYAPTTRNGMGPLRLPTGKSMQGWWLRSDRGGRCLMAPDPISSGGSVQFTGPCSATPRFSWRLTPGTI